MGNAAKKVIVLILVLGIIYRPLLLLYGLKSSFLVRNYSYKYELLRKEYYSSQYVQKEKPNIIPDNALEAFAGGFFLKGGNPILIVHDQPPLGRYIISFSIFLFDNVLTVVLFLTIFSIIGMFLISKSLIKNVFLSLIPVGLFVNEPLFLNKFLYSPLLEPIQLPFIIFSLYFFIKGLTDKYYIKWILLSSLMLGFVISIRFFVLGGVLLVTMFASLFFWRKYNYRRILLFLLSLPLSLLILFMSYIKTVQSGYSFFQILGIQKYMFFYHKSALILPFSFWDLLLFNRWHTWWGDKSISFDPEWIIVWPIATFLVGILLIFVLFKKIKITLPETVILIWVLGYSLFLSTGYTSTRYFLPLIPFLYILSTLFLVKYIKFLFRK